MEIKRVRLSGWRGLDVEMGWAPIVVLFGVNDAGKTNILEALDYALGDEQRARGSNGFHDLTAEVGYETSTTRIPAGANVNQGRFHFTARLDAQASTIDWLTDVLEAEIMVVVRYEEEGTPGYRTPLFPSLDEPPPAERDWWLADERTPECGANPRVHAVCRHLASKATELAPAFVRDRYAIVVRPIEPVPRTGAARVIVAIRQIATGDEFPLKLAGSGITVWVAYSLAEAARLLGEDHEDGTIAGLLLPEEQREYDEWWNSLPTEEEVGDHAPEPDGVLVFRSSESWPPRVALYEGAVYLIDEPERHLHPTAQEQAARWIVSRTQFGANVVVATHSLAFLDLPSTQVRYYMVYRDDAGSTRKLEVTGDVIGGLRSPVGQRPVSPAATLQLLRAVLIVEGEHDELVLEHFYGAELRAERIHVLPLRGTRNLPALPEAELIRLLNVPVMLLLDALDADELVLLQQARPRKPQGNRRLVEDLYALLRDWKPQRSRPHVVPFSLPDILAALPDRCVHSALAHDGLVYPGMTAILAAYRASRSQAVNFKTFFQSRTGLGVEPNTRFIKRVLSHCSNSERPAPELERAMNEVLALAASARDA